ncbi:MAG: mandelate racemase/muconate lactonizing enzyme family protein [Trueperaceae bacterium]|nr:MAG: mandelate racemase/muconate lactonizing enzyme family protein [Trueperaceae bacterium]
MKVTRVTAIPLVAPLDKPWSTGVATFTAFYTTLVRVETDDGVIGHGECLARYAPRAWADLVNEVLAPVVVGSDPFDVEHTWDRMYRSFGSFSGHSRGLVLEAISGIDIALWDVMGQASGQPVARLLGGTPRDVAAYASSVTVDTIDAMVAEARSFVDGGFTSMKIKIGRDVPTERGVLTAIREAVGPDVELYVDSNGAYEFPEAIRIADMLEEVDVRWFEEPVRTEYRGSYAKLRAVTKIPLAAGEGEFTRWGMHELLQTGAIDIVQPDICRSGGITETRKMAMLATLYHARYAPHVGGSGALCAAASVHLAAAMPNFYTYECSVPANPLRDDLVLEPVGHGDSVRNGVIPVPDRPGLGIEIDEKVVERYRVDD